MAKINENDLSAILLENFTLRTVEPHIYYVLPSSESANEYDTEFGFIYDLVACNPIYNRLICKECGHPFRATPLSRKR